LDHRLDNGSCMSGDVHVQFCEKLVGKIHRLTHLVVCCETEEDAKNFLEELKTRLAKFGLEVSPEKTRIIKFGRREWVHSKRTGEKAETFNFLGFTHYCDTSRRGYFCMKHKTSKENLCRKLKEVKEWMKKVRNRYTLKEWWPTLRAKVIGYYNYFGISGNYCSLKQFYTKIFWLAYKWINRRSQRKSMTLARYIEYLQWNPIPKPKIYHKLYELKQTR